MAAIATLLEVAEAMMAVVIDGTEFQKRQLGLGMWAPKKDAA